MVVESQDASSHCALHKLPGHRGLLIPGATTCRGNSGAPGVLGTTPENLEPYEYDPQLSRQLLEEIGYICGRPNSAPNCEAQIDISGRANRIPRNTELVESMATFMREAGINARANLVETAIWTEQGLCGVDHPQARIAGWQGATETRRPTDCVVPQIRDSIGFGYETLDYAKFRQPPDALRLPARVCLRAGEERGVEAGHHNGR
jgi:ABC-type transport system substrate-binding protein